MGPTEPALSAENWNAIVSPDNSLQLLFANGERQVFQVGVVAWGPNWGWVGYDAREKAKDDTLAVAVPLTIDKGKGHVIDLKFQARKADPRKLVLRYDLTAATDVPLTMVIAGVGVGPAVKGTILLSSADGKETEWKLPLGRAAATSPIAKATLRLEGIGDIGLTLDPPCPVACDNDLRIMLAHEVLKQGTRSVTIACELPGETGFVARQEDLDKLARPLATPDWFAFAPSDKVVPGVISMNDWLEKPAGKRGGVRMVGDRFEFADGTPVKFWGTNLSYGSGCAPEKDDARFTAARFANYGINGVRLHKFSYPPQENGIGDAQDATRMDPKGLDRLDFFSAELKARGVYFGWSHTFGFHVAPGNRDRLAAYDEIEKSLKRKTYAFINFAEDVQDLMIEMVVNLLKHKNPYTGLTYAEEPALSFIELQNEDDIFFYTSTGAFDACPTYKKLFIGRFCDWLKAKYGGDEGLKKSWQAALAPGESIAAKNIVPQTNPWFFSDGHLPGQKDGPRRRLLDTAQFLHEAQNKFYGKFVKAIREAGYKGPLNGSPWQAPSMLPHYYNLRSDYLAGYIDRHNYSGERLFDSMLAQPGSGYFSTGLQQVGDRPFGLSEWITVYPSLYSAEGPAIIAAYGMGLQGWDASYQFQSQSNRRVFDDRVGWFPWGVWEADVPAQLGQYPALARMIYRGDVKEGEVISTRCVSPQNLAAGEFDFTDKVVQQGDVKSFGGSVPPEALAAGRVVVEFTEASKPSTFPKMEQFRRGTTILANNRQLAWSTGGKGAFTVNTPGTKAVVGFADGKRVTLGNVTIEVGSPYASIFLTALDKNATLADGKSALLTVVARNCNTGFKYFALDQRVLDNGKAPILLEPVQAAIAIAGRKVARVNVLDHDGRRTDKTLEVKDGRFAIDGRRDRTLYYEVVFEAE